LRYPNIFDDLDLKNQDFDSADDLLIEYTLFQFFLIDNLFE